MKKKMMALAAFVILTVTSTFAGSNDVSKNAEETLAATFAKATGISWEKESNYYKATFTMNGQVLKALLSEDGEMMSVSRNILSTELPINLQASLSKNYSNCWIADLTEYAISNKTIYYLTVENADEKIFLESTRNGSWSLLKKDTK